METCESTFWVLYELWRSLTELFLLMALTDSPFSAKLQVHPQILQMSGKQGLYRDFKGLPPGMFTLQYTVTYSSFMEKTSHLAGLPFLPCLHDILAYLTQTGLPISCHPNAQSDDAKGHLRHRGSLCESYAEKSGILSSVLMCPILRPKDAEYNQSPMHTLIIFYHLKCKTCNCIPSPL